MGIQCLGDRLTLMDFITLLKKKKKEAEMSGAQWSGVTPGPGCAYKEDCGECCVAYLCPCCLAKTFWRVTGQGIFYKKEPPCGLFTGSGRLQPQAKVQTWTWFYEHNSLTFAQSNLAFHLKLQLPEIL
jgi:hypothetical protein